MQLHVRSAVQCSYAVEEAGHHGSEMYQPLQALSGSKPLRLTRQNPIRLRHYLGQDDMTF